MSSVRSSKIINEPKWIESLQCWQQKVRRDGKRYTATSSIPGNEGKVQCRARAKAWKEDGIINGNTKVSRLSEKFIEELKVSTSKSNWYNYAHYAKNYLKPQKGNKKVGDLTEQDLQDVILYAFKHPVKGTNKVDDLSAKTLKNIMDFLKALMKYARKNNASALYPENLYIPKTARKSKKGSLQPDDIITLFSNSKTTDHKKVIEEWYIHAFRYEVITGHRPGEIFGLKKSDIKTGYCICNRAINIYGETTDGKNENAQRNYEIPELAKEVLKDQAAMLKKSNVSSIYVFPSPDGTPVKYNTYYKHWCRYRNYNKISERTPYEIRHTWFSINKNVPDALLKPMGGHGRDFDSMGTYGHPINGESHQTAVMVNDNLKNILNKK